MNVMFFRLKPGLDLKTEIEKKLSEHTITAGCIVSCVGGLSQATVRMAGATPESQDIRTYKGDYQITSLVGTVSTNGVHLHMSFSDSDGIVHGGHLKEGTIVYPTAEIAIGYEETMSFTREYDEETGFDELVVN